MCKKIHATKNTVNSGFKPCEITDEGRSDYNGIWKTLQRSAEV